MKALRLDAEHELPQRRIQHGRERKHETEGHEHGERGSTWCGGVSGGGEGWPGLARLPSGPWSKSRSSSASIFTAAAGDAKGGSAASGCWRFPMAGSCTMGVDRRNPGPATAARWSSLIG